MPYIALNDDGKRVKPSQVEKPASVSCPECRQAMHIVSSHEHRSSFRARHFSHNPNRTAAGGAGGCGGESDRHVQMKQIALHKLEWEFDVETTRTEQQVGERVADVYTRFNSAHEKYGYGIIAEVQYKNEDKNIEAVTNEYLKHGYSVVWLWEDDFSKHDVDLDRGTWRTVWPEMVPKEEEWSGHASGYHYDVHNDQIVRGPTWHPVIDANAVWRVDDSTDARPTKSKASARLPPEWADEQAQKIWNEQNWTSLFTPGVDIGDFWDFSKVPATLPPEWADEHSQRLWREKEWAQLFKPPTHLNNTTREGERMVDIPFDKWSSADGNQSPLRPNFDLEVGKNVPTGGFSDVICLRCGSTWYYTEPHSKSGVWKRCPECGHDINFEQQAIIGAITESEAKEANESAAAEPIHPRQYQKRP